MTERVWSLYSIDNILAFIQVRREVLLSLIAHVLAVHAFCFLGESNKNVVSLTVAGFSQNNFLLPKHKLAAISSCRCQNKVYDTWPSRTTVMTRGWELALTMCLLSCSLSRRLNFQPVTNICEQGRYCRTPMLVVPFPHTENNALHDP